MKKLYLITRIPNKFILFIIISITASFEGIGIASLIPVISFVTNEVDLASLEFPFSILPDLFHYLNIEIMIL